MRKITSIVYLMLIYVVGFTQVAPVAAPDYVVINQGASAIIIDVQDNDIDLDGDPITTSVIVSPISGGSITIINGDSISYTPPAIFFGEDTIVYQVCDLGPLCDSDTIFITVNQSTAPVANPDYVIISEDAPSFFIDVQDNDSDANSDALTSSVLAGATSGATITIFNGDSIMYTPFANFSGQDTIVYQVCDPGFLCDADTIFITVNPVNDAPVADPDYVTINQGSSAIFIDVQDNDIDVDNDPLTTSIIVAPTSGGSVIVFNGDSIMYTPPAIFSGEDTIVYQVCDLGPLCDSDTIFITVTPSTAPVVNPDYVVITEDSTNVIIDVQDNDIDANSDPLTTQVISGSTAGSSVSIINNDSIGYTPPANFYGEDTIIYQVCNTVPLCDSDTIFITVTSVNDAEFSYANTSFCLNDTNPIPLISGSTGGTFSNSNIGLTLNNGTGEINLTTSTAGSYTIKYVTSGPYPDSTSLSILINDLIRDTITDTVCDSITFAGITRTISGTYSDTISTAITCDSIVTLELVVNYTIRDSANIIACNNYVFGGDTLIANGTYSDTLTGVTTCDSIITINLTFTSVVTDTLSAIIICSNDSALIFGSYETVAGWYVDSLTSVSLCDSLVYQELIVLPVSTTNVNDTICFGDSINIAGNWYTIGTVIETIANGSSNGCDSLITHNIVQDSTSSGFDLGGDIVNCVTSSVILYGPIGYSSYSWNTGALTQSISITGASVGVGIYDYWLTVVGGSNNCSATDTVKVEFINCVDIAELGIDAFVKIYPNPATGENLFLNIDNIDLAKTIKVSVLNNLGQSLISDIYTTGGTHQLNVSNLDNGAYYVQFMIADKVFVKQLIYTK